MDLILLGPTGDRRQLQDSSILGDVWIKYAANPRKEWDLLITPEKKFPAGAVAATIAKAVRKLRSKIDPEDKDSANVACLQALIAAKLTFQELLQVVVPMTVWWKDRTVQKQLAKSSPRKRSLKPSQTSRVPQLAGRRRRRGSAVPPFHPTQGAGPVCSPRRGNLMGERTWQLRARNCRRLGRANRSQRGRR